MHTTYTLDKATQKDYAQMGAEVQLQMLAQEAAAIYRVFPSLRPKKVAPARAKKAPPSRKGRKLKLSPAQRKAIGRRMKKYWASRRKGQPK
jgi:hypothetical protein